MMAGSGSFTGDSCKCNAPSIIPTEGDMPAPQGGSNLAWGGGGDPWLHATYKRMRSLARLSATTCVADLMSFVQVLHARSPGGERKREGGMGRRGSPRCRGKRVLPHGEGEGSLYVALTRSISRPRPLLVVSELGGRGCVGERVSREGVGIYSQLRKSKAVSFMLKWSSDRCG